MMCCVLLHEWQGWRGERVAGNGAGGGACVGTGVEVLVAVVLAFPWAFSRVAIRLITRTGPKNFGMLESEVEFTSPHGSY